ncbi:hypothetical protein ACP4OV_030170 [Aristida adscensionis]
MAMAAQSMLLLTLAVLVLMPPADGSAAAAGVQPETCVPTIIKAGECDPDECQLACTKVNGAFADCVPDGCRCVLCYASSTSGGGGKGLERNWH